MPIEFLDRNSRTFRISQTKNTSLSTLIASLCSASMAGKDLEELGSLRKRKRRTQNKKKLLVGDKVEVMSPSFSFSLFGFCRKMSSWAVIVVYFVFFWLCFGFCASSKAKHSSSPQKEKNLNMGFKRGFRKIATLWMCPRKETSFKKR